MLSLCINHVTTVESPFRSSVFHFLAKLSKICEIFFSCEKKTLKLSLLHTNVNTSSHRKGNLWTNHSLSVRVMTTSSRYAQQIIITPTGTMKLGFLLTLTLS